MLWNRVELIIESHQSDWIKSPPNPAAGFMGCPRRLNFDQVFRLKFDQA